MRARLGESLNSIRKLDRSNPQVTTESVDAYQAHALGQVQFGRSLWAAAIPFFRRAIELDPTFAMALQQLSTSYLNAGEGTRAAEYAKKAFALADRVSERERLQITSSYYMNISGDLNKAIDALAAHSKRQDQFITWTSLDIEIVR